ncbi:MAG: hypothetical protein ACI80N_004323 [Gammaproteobacteria bacterium]|jgi:hypothetical protein
MPIRLPAQALARGAILVFPKGTLKGSLVR